MFYIHFYIGAVSEAKWHVHSDQYMTEKNKSEYTEIVKVVKAWQVIEVIILLLLIPGTLGLAVVFTGDSNKLFNNYMTLVLPFLLFIFIVKIVATVAFLKNKKWSYYYNYTEGIVLFAASAALTGLTVTGGIVLEDISLLKIALSLVFPVVFMFLFWKLIGIYRKILNSVAVKRSE